MYGLGRLRSKPRLGMRSRLSSWDKRIIVETALKDSRLFGYLRTIGMRDLSLSICEGLV